MNTQELSSLLYQVVTNYYNKFYNEVASPITQDSGLTPPQEIQTALDNAGTLMRATSSRQQAPEDLPEVLLPWLKRAVLDARLDLAKQLDDSRSRVSEPALVEALDRKLAPYAEIMEHDWFKKTTAARTPHIADFLTVERAEARLGETAEQPPRHYDEKFHILQAPTLFFPDLSYYRTRCGMRNVSLVVAYMDIDDFKSFNNKHGETYIDIYLLPRFMAALEAHVYGRGFAYRFGGDEYAMLLPNCDASTGRDVMIRFRNRISRINYRDIKDRPTVSIGFCTVERDCYFTNRELLRFAEQAKSVAKKNGRDCIATFRDTEYRQAYVPGVTDEL